MKAKLFNSLLCLVIFTSYQVSAQQVNLKSEEAIRFKGKHVIIITTGDTIVDSILINTVENKWRFSDSIQYMDLESSNIYVKENPNEFLRLRLSFVTGQLVTTVGNGIHKTEMGRTTYGDMIKLLLFEDDSKRKFGIAFPSNSGFSKEIMTEVIQRACGVIDGVEKMGSWNKLCFKNRDNAGEKVAKTTLLVPMEYLKDAGDSTKLKAAYPYKIQFATTSQIQQAIDESNESYSYIIAVEEVVNYHMHFICTANNSEVLSIAARLTQGPGDFKNETKHMYIDFKTFKKLVKNLK